MACNCRHRAQVVRGRVVESLPGAGGFATVYVSRPLWLELEGVYYNFTQPGEYFVDAKHAEKLLRLSEVSLDGFVESDNTPQDKHESDSGDNRGGA